jgi:LEA14-like dessication related protein
MLTLLSLSSCNFFKKPTVDKIRDIKVLSITPDKSLVEISLVVNNPNSYKIRVSKLDIELLNKDRGKVGIASLNKEIEIPKKASTTIDFKVELDTRPVVKMVSGIDQKVQFFVTGKGRGKALGMGKNFSFDEPYELDLQEHLQNLLSRFSASGQSLFKVQRTTVEKVGIGETELHVNFMILNPYGFTFNFKGFPAEIYLNDKLAGTGNLQNQLSFNENIYSKDGVMIFKLSNLKSILGALKGVFKGEVAYTVKGKVMIDAMGMEINRPYEYKGSLPLNIWGLLLN